MQQTNSSNTNTRVQQVVVVGATGLIGSAIVEHLTSGQAAQRYHVLEVTHETDPGLNLVDPDSILEFFATVGSVDHVVVAAGEARFGSFEQLDEAAFEVGLSSKLMGQVRVAMAALPRLSVGGSVTLTSGALSHSPIPGSAGVALVNGAIDSFVRAIAIDAPKGRRINVVSPGWIRETRIKLGLAPDPGTSAHAVGRLYVDAIESNASGQIFSVESAGARDTAA